MRATLMVGNWKMHKTVAEAMSLVEGLKPHVAALKDTEVVLCPPFTALGAVARALAGSPIGLGAQNVFWEKEGAFTGEVSAPMLAELGCAYVIVGHSERRHHFAETDEMVQRKARAAVTAGLRPIVCIGESLREREAGSAFDVLDAQVKGSLRGLSGDSGIVVAYEPVWAIGTGRTATPAQAQEVHAFIRKLLEGLLSPAAAAATRILYGGSVQPDNVRDLMTQPDVDGALVGGASLDANSFGKIVRFKG
jgi:triosephosphate isomerase (TIM)